MVSVYFLFHFYFLICYVSRIIMNKPTHRQNHRTDSAKYTPTGSLHCVACDFDNIGSICIAIDSVKINKIISTVNMVNKITPKNSKLLLTEERRWVDWLLAFSCFLTKPVAFCNCIVQKASPIPEVPLTASLYHLHYLHNFTTYCIHCFSTLQTVELHTHLHHLDYLFI